MKLNYHCANLITTFILITEGDQMSCVPKFDAYFNMLNNDDVKSIVVPAKTMKHLSNNVHFYQNSPTRNTKGLYLSCRKILNKKTFTEDFTVFVDGDGRWDGSTGKASHYIDYGSVRVELRKVGDNWLSYCPTQEKWKVFLNIKNHEIKAL